MTTRIRYAVQYPAKEGSGLPCLYKNAAGQGVLWVVEALLLDRPLYAMQFAGLLADPPRNDPPDADHLPARVVEVRETITRELVEDDK